jgi:hypothetical protein
MAGFFGNRSLPPPVFDFGSGAVAPGSLFGVAPGRLFSGPPRGPAVSAAPAAAAAHYNPFQWHQDGNMTAEEARIRARLTDAEYQAEIAAAAQRDSFQWHRDENVAQPGAARINNNFQPGAARRNNNNFQPGAAAQGGRKSRKNKSRRNKSRRRTHHKKSG